MEICAVDILLTWLDEGGPEGDNFIVFPGNVSNGVNERNAILKYKPVVRN